MTRGLAIVGLFLVAVAAALWAHSTVALAIAAATGAAGAVAIRRGAGQVMRPAGAPPPAAGGAEAGTLRALVDRMSEGVLLVRADDIVLVANRAAAAILDRPREAMEGVSLIRATRDHAFVQALRDATGVPLEVALGDDRVVEVTAAIVALPPVRAVLTIRDLTALRRAERARADLVANISHELRTPIAAARAIAETLEAGVDEPEQRARFLELLTGELEQLSGMVERLLRLSRLDSQAEPFEVESLDAGDLVAAALARVRPLAERAEVRVRSEGVAAPGAIVVLADRERVLEVLTNLLDNAIRYSPRGGEVTVALDETVGGDAGMVRYCVRDQGPGILPAERRRVFERFYTADRARGDAGAGLGLAIARQIVSRLGGEIWVADETPGATLCLTLPRAGSAGRDSA